MHCAGWICKTVLWLPTTPTLLGEVKQWWKLFAIEHLWFKNELWCSAVLWMNAFHSLFNTIFAVCVCVTTPTLLDEVKQWREGESVHWSESPDHCKLANEWVWQRSWTSRTLIEEPLAQVSVLARTKSGKAHPLHKVRMYMYNVGLGNTYTKLTCLRVGDTKFNPLAITEFHFYKFSEAIDTLYDSCWSVGTWSQCSLSLFVGSAPWWGCQGPW